MAIDPSIISDGARMQQLIQQNNMNQLQELGGNLGRIVLGRRINQMRQLEKPEDQQAFANNSIFSPFLNDTLRADKAAAAKAAADKLKFDADLAKARAEEEKIRTETKGASLKNSVDLLENANRALAVVAQTGDAYAATLALNNSYKAGAITPELYEQYSQQIKSLSNKPQELKQYVQGIILSGEENAMKYIQADQNTVLNNKTSRENNQNSVNAQIYKTDKDYQLGQQELQVKQVLEQQKIDLEQNKGEIMAGADGMAYIFMPNQPPDKSYKPLLGPDGKHAKAPAANSGKGGMSATAQKELFEVTDSISAAQNGIENLRAALNYSKTAYDGFGATQRAAVAGNLTDSEAATATAMLNNIVTGNALEMLKATFGGAPTEGERAILLQLQGSANLPSAQREAIYNRAIQMAERRLQSNLAKAEGIRNGSYFQSQQGGGGSGGESLSYFK